MPERNEQQDPIKKFAEDLEEIDYLPSKPNLAKRTLRAALGGLKRVAKDPTTYFFMGAGVLLSSGITTCNLDRVIEYSARQEYPANYSPEHITAANYIIGSLLVEAKAAIEKDDYAIPLPNSQQNRRDLYSSIQVFEEELTRPSLKADHRLRLHREMDLDWPPRPNAGYISLAGIFLGTAIMTVSVFKMSRSK